MGRGREEVLCAGSSGKRGGDVVELLVRMGACFYVCGSSGMAGRLRRG